MKLYVNYIYIRVAKIKNSFINRYFPGGNNI